MLPEGTLIGRDESGDCEAIGPQDRRWFRSLAVIATLLILSPWWAPDLYEWLMEPDRLKLAVAALAVLILAWRLLAFCLKQNPIDYVTRGGPAGPHDHGGRS